MPEKRREEGEVNCDSRAYCSVYGLRVELMRSGGRRDGKETGCVRPGIRTITHLATPLVIGQGHGRISIHVTVRGRSQQ